MSRIAFSPARSSALTAIAGAICLALSAAPRLAAADTVVTFDLTTGSVLGGSSSSAFCTTSALCPTQPTYGLGTSEPLSGTVSFDLTKDTMSFDIALAQNAVFGTGGPTVGTGSSFVATNQGVTVSSHTTGGVTTYSFSPGTSGDSALTTLLLSSGFTQTQNSPLMTGIECSENGSTGSCSLTIGELTGAGSGNLLINGGGTSYNGIMSVSANLTEVPLPASAWLLLTGLGATLLFASRRRGYAPLAAC